MHADLLCVCVCAVCLVAGSLNDIRVHQHSILRLTRMAVSSSYLRWVVVLRIVEVRQQQRRQVCQLLELCVVAAHRHHSGHSVERRLT